MTDSFANWPQRIVEKKKKKERKQWKAEDDMIHAQLLKLLIVIDYQKKCSSWLHG